MRREDLDGTLAPFLRAFESPIAIACLREVTRLPERPERAVPRFILCISLRTAFWADAPYLRFEEALPPDKDRDP